MELEEAKKIILSYIDRYEYVNKSVRYDENGYKATLEKHIEAFNTVIGDLHALQNLVDEKNDELEHLQKENEELKNIDLTTVHIKGVCDEKERWRNKIRKMIETLEEQEKAELEPKDVLVFPKDTAYLSAKVEYYHKKNILQDLLKEE